MLFAEDAIWFLGYVRTVLLYRIIWIIATFSNIPCGMEFSIFISSLFIFFFFIFITVSEVSVCTLYTSSVERKRNNRPKLWTMNTSPLNIVYRMNSWHCLVASPGYGFETVHHFFFFFGLKSYFVFYEPVHVTSLIAYIRIVSPYGIPDYPNIMCRQSFENEHFLFYLCAVYFINNDKNAWFSFCHINRTNFIAPRVYITTAILFYQMMKKRDEKKWREYGRKIHVECIGSWRCRLCTLILNIEQCHHVQRKHIKLSHLKGDNVGHFPFFNIQCQPGFFFLP